MEPSDGLADVDGIGEAGRAASGYFDGGVDGDGRRGESVVGAGLQAVGFDCQVLLRRCVVFCMFCLFG